MRSLRLWPLALILVVVGCGGEDTPMSPPVAADVDQYLGSLPAWTAFSPPAAPADIPVSDPVDSEEEVDGSTYQCQSTRYSLTQTPDKIVTLNPDVEVLWVGSLLQGSGYLGGIGTLAELPIRQRAPIQISIDLLTGNNTRTVADPNLATVNQAIGELIQAASDAGHRAGSNIVYSQTSYHSYEEAALKLGFSATYSGATVKGSLAASSSARTSSVMVSYMQRMFTVSQVLPQTPGEVFSDAFTQAQLQDQVERGRMGPENLPVYVSSVVYGRMLTFTMTAAGTASEIRAALEIAVGENGGELSGSQRTLLESAEIGIVAIGGDASNAEALIRTGDFSAYFEEDAALTTARPLSYTVRNLADNTIASVSETTEYNVRECAAEVTGARYRITLDGVRWLERATLCLLPVCQIFLSADFTVPDSYHSVQAVRQTTQDVMCMDGYHGFPAAAAPVEVSLHFDGRDRVDIFGDVWTDWPSHFTWPLGRIRFTGTIPLGNGASSVWSGGGCHRYGVYYTVVKIADLTD